MIIIKIGNLFLIILVFFCTKVATISTQAINRNSTNPTNSSTIIEKSTKDSSIEKKKHSFFICFNKIVVFI
jgi:hypothetical protein